MPRSLKKGPFVASHVFERVEEMNASGKKDIIKTILRELNPTFSNSLKSCLKKISFFSGNENTFFIKIKYRPISFRYLSIL